MILFLGPFFLVFLEHEQWKHVWFGYFKNCFKKLVFSGKKKEDISSRSVSKKYIFKNQVSETKTERQYQTAPPSNQGPQNLNVEYALISSFKLCPLNRGPGHQNSKMFYKHAGIDW